MLFGDVTAIALSIIGFLLSLQGLWLVCRALWPGRVDAAAGRCERNPFKCLLLGAVVTGAFALAAALLGGLGTFGQLSMFALGLVYLMYAGAGASGLVTLIGRRLASPADADRPWKATVRGGVVLELACLVPVLGWVGILPISFILGAGAMTLACVGRRREGHTGGRQAPVNGRAVPAAQRELVPELALEPAGAPQ